MAGVHITLERVDRMTKTIACLNTFWSFFPALLKIVKICVVICENYHPLQQTRQTNILADIAQLVPNNVNAIWPEHMCGLRLLLRGRSTCYTDTLTRCRCYKNLIFCESGMKRCAPTGSFYAKCSFPESQRRAYGHSSNVLHCPKSIYPRFLS